MVLGWRRLMSWVSAGCEICPAPLGLAAELFLCCPARLRRTALAVARQLDTSQLPQSGPLLCLVTNGGPTGPLTAAHEAGR